MKRWIWLLLLVAVFGWWISERSPDALVPAPGVLAPEVPKQGPVRGSPPTQLGEFSVSALHSFEVRARVLGRKDYWLGTEADISPTDLALGWGRMSDTAVLQDLRISQGGRFYYYRWGAEGPPIPAQEIVRSSANMHLIPADAGVAAALDRIIPGQVVHIEGWLVHVEREDGWRWTSSTRRDDSGAGACELVLVASVSTTQ